MNVTNMKNAMKKMVFPLLAGGIMWSAGAAMAQDIINITSDQALSYPGYTYYTASGNYIDIKIRLYGNFALRNNGGTTALYPQLRMIVNGDVAWADLYTLSAESTTQGYKTYAVFRYVIKPGDMACPLKIYGSAGSGSSSGTPYQFYWNGWEVYNQSTSSNAVWQINTAFTEMAQTTDNLNFAGQKIVLKTLDFADATSPTTVAATETTSWHVTTVNPISSAVVDFYVWSPNTNLVQIGSVAGQSALHVSMPTGTTDANFSIKGLATGTADIYLQRTADYQAYINGTNGLAGATNYVKRTISVTAAPEPTVSILMTDTGTDTTTLNETNSLNTGSFTVNLSQAFTNDVYVRLNLAPSGYVAFATSPYVVRIPAGSLASSEQKFSVPDGNVTSMWGVVVSPTITNTAAATYFTRLRTATVYVQNVKPTLTLPKSTDTIIATRGVPYGYAWQAADVTPDLTTGMKATWNFNGETITNVTGSSGTINYTFNTTGTKTVKVTVTDKDGAVSDEIQFTVTVNTPAPKPSVRVVPTALEYNETTTNSTGSLTVYLSESYSDDVWVLLTSKLQGGAQSNIVFATTNAIRIAQGNTNSAPIKFSLPDGTQASSIYGIDIVPSVTNAPANTYFTDLQQVTIFVDNVNPTITYPLARDITLAPSPEYTNVPMSQPFSFTYSVNDVDRDGPAMQLIWDFGDGTTGVVAGASGYIQHTYNTLGTKYVTVQAFDKDAGSSDKIKFPIKVVPPPPPPTVSILSPAGVLSETTTPKTGSFIVQLSEAFTNVVTVGLTFTPVTNAVNGSIILSTNRVTFAVGETEKTVFISARDGTDASWGSGFTIIPTVLGNAAATNYFKTVTTGYVEVMNVNPSITTPVSTDVTTDNILYTVPQGAPYTFTWVVSDVPDDWSTMRVDWDFGDGHFATGYGRSGNITNTYTTTGDVVVKVTATDKDGGTSFVQFKISVQPTEEVMVTPIGPNFESSYYGASGLGYGTVFSEQARTPAANRGNTYYFYYNPGVTAATLEARPYKTGSVGYYNVTNYSATGDAIVSTNNITRDSFFFTWVGTDQGLTDDAINPVKSENNTSITLPATQTTTTGTTTEGVEIRKVKAIFSLEWRIADNMGDINQDGIPDKVAFAIESANSSGGTTTDTTSGSTPAGLKNLSGYNQDADDTGAAVGDYLPVNPTGMGGTFDFRPVADGKGGNDFTAYLEVRGYHPGLNKPNISDPDGDKDEPYTDPTLEDTDGDGLPDGWEFYFWYNAKFKGMTGSRYNPNDIAKGTVILSKDIFKAFEPSATAASLDGDVISPIASATNDLDNDGLTDFEEMVIGTNPVNWDTDGDGLCDSWELARGLNPTLTSDGGAANPDGDYMAYASVPRKYVRVYENNGAATNTYLAPVNMDVHAGSVATNSGFTTWYNYGNASAPIAVGRPVTLSSNSIVLGWTSTNALVLHFQVLREFGFDPRTAWTDALNTPDHPTRWPAWLASVPNTKPFTSQDEYLLIKFMSENRLNGATDTMPSSVATWKGFSTDPLTPDSDVTTVARDGMPDGWELYVSIPPDADLSIPGNRWMSISPWNPLDGDADSEPATIINGVVPIAARDGLINRREFGGYDSSAAYTNAALYNASNFVGVVSITRPSVDTAWINKFWPSNPWSHDTDGDGLNDLAERAFIYGTATDNGTSCVQGGGLNPCSVDTDLDALPDAWEFEFTGTLPTSGTFGGAVAPYIVITNGMDGTVGLDYNQDWDSDGLLNYQEYWTQAVRSFRYDITDEGTTNIFGKLGLPLNATFKPSSLFTEVTNGCSSVFPDGWDRARYPWGNANANLYVLLPLVNMYDPDNKPYLYACTDPRNYDTDEDGMDDYYEMFHGLNPLLGDPINDDNTFVESADRVARACLVQGAPLIDYNFNEWNADPFTPLSLDFVNYPWLTGLPEADPDADGLRNSEEQLQPNTPMPAYSHTDPTPLWMTDDSNTNSLTARFYEPMGNAAHAMGAPYSFDDSMFYWPPYPVVPPDFVYTFERNEGYDTDNDGISDKAELVNSRNSLSDPLDSDDPVRRQAFWFSGTNSAASATKGFTLGEWTLRSFTLELWARPEVVGREQVLLERVFAYSPSDLSTTNKVVRRNFRIGIAADGRAYAMFENAGAHDSHTASVYVYGNVLATNQWVHLAARMDGSTSTFTLFINGQVSRTIATALVPANGVLILESDPLDPVNDLNYTVIAGGVIVGAENDRPDSLEEQEWKDYSNFYGGYIDEVRIWDGARSNDEILSNYKRRLSKNDLIENRKLVRTEEAKGYSRVWGNSLQLDPELLYYYNFDNVFGADATNSIATSPRGFEDLAVTINQPVGAEVGWWSKAEVRSTVYNDYKYLPRIENSVAHLPLFGFATNSGSFISVVMTNTVADSVFWTHTAVGKTPGSFNFPNTGNPYDIASDLLPLGDAFAKQSVDMWDDQGASGVWYETATDSDSDGLPDWWEMYVSGTTTGVNWNDVNPSTGMTYGEQYQRDIAKGMTPNNNPTSNPTGWTVTDSNGDGIPDSAEPTVTNPVVKQTADSDGDGMPDWWENIFNLNPASADGDDGALGDPDKDGLSNLAEYMISEVYKFRYLSPLQFKTDAKQTVSDYFLKEGSLTLGAMFTDHDFMEDAWEDQFDPSYTSRYVYDPFGDGDEDGWSNWAECRYRIYKAGTRPDISMTTEVLGLMSYEFPVPTLETTLRYKGFRSGGTLVVQFFSDPTMNGSPDATYTIPNDSTTVTTKTQPIGYRSDRTVNATLSPGSIRPGTVSIMFTDLWTSKSGNTGFDSDGIIYSSLMNGRWDEIGTIDYVTGKMTLDLLYFKHGRIILSNGTGTNRSDYIECDTAFIQMKYTAQAISAWPKTVYLGQADSGYIREGTNYVFTFMDLDSSGTWDAGEPCGVATPFATDIGWDYNRLNVELTDYTPGYLRLSLATGRRSEDVFAGVGVAAGSGSGSGSAATAGLEERVRVRRSSVDGYSAYSKVILDKVIKTSRTGLHEGDFFAQGDLGLDWGLIDVPTSMNRETAVYEVYVGNATILTNNLLVTTFTNRFEVGSDRVQAKATSPLNGKYVYSARPTFRWTMPDNYTAFAIEIKKGSSSGPTIYQSGSLQAPYRDVDTGEYVWQAPIHAGSKLPSGQIFASNTLYAWRVIALNSKFTLTTAPITWSSWNVFRLDVNAPSASSGYGELRASVKYYGPATNLSGRVKVQVFNNAGFAGVPEQQYTLTDADLSVLTNSALSGTNAVLRGLTPSATAGKYYVRAFLDQNTNSVREVWESWGYANYYGLTDTPYSPRPFTVAVSTAGEVANVIIEDADSDQDWFPDAWEYEQHPGDADFLAKTGPSANWSDTIGDTEINSTLTTTSPFLQSSLLMALAMGTTDLDDDGIGDLAELVLGMNASSASTVADGYTDAQKISLGLSGSDSLSLGITDLGVGGSGVANLTWELDVQKAANVSRAFLSAITGVASDGTATYVIEYTPSLLNANWQPVQTGDVTLDGDKTYKKVIDSTSAIDPAKGFYRVRLVK